MTKTNHHVPANTADRALVLQTGLGAFLFAVIGLSAVALAALYVRHFGPAPAQAQADPLNQDLQLTDMTGRAIN